jgi:hypothetical protein
VDDRVTRCHTVIDERCATLQQMNIKIHEVCRVKKKAYGRHVYSTPSHFTCTVQFLSCNIDLKAQEQRNIDTCESTRVQLS